MLRLGLLCRLLSFGLGTIQHYELNKMKILQVIIIYFIYTGFGEPVYFYVYCIFALNALLPAGIFLLSTYLRSVCSACILVVYASRLCLLHSLSDSVFGGVLSAAMFFYNHGEVSLHMNSKFTTSLLI